MKDLFAKERAEFQARKTIKKEDDSFAVFLKPLLSSLKGDLEPLIKSVKGKDGETPVKGSDYFTASEIQQIKDEIIALIPPGEKGKDGIVDYNTISKLVTSAVAKLPKPKDGKDGSPGRDAIVNTAKIVDEVLKNLPKTKEYLTEEKLEKILKEKISNSPEKRVVGYSSLSQLTDVILTGVPQDSKGNYILTPGGSGSGHTIEDEGTPLTQRTNLNFVGAGVTVTDDAGNDATVVTISGGGGGGSGDVVGPASAVDNSIAVFDSTTGKIIKDGDALIATTPTTSTVVKRDNNANIYANNYFANLTSTVSAGGTTVLTVASSRVQRLTGSSTQTFQLPDATTLPLSSIFEFDNNSSSSLVITNAGAATQYTIPAGGAVLCFLTANGTANGTWDFHAMAPSSVTWDSGVTGLVMNSVLTTSPSVGSGASSATVPSFIPQRGANTTGFGGDGTNLHATIAGTPALTIAATNTTAPKFTATTDNAYDATTWNDSLRAPTENAVRDKIESVSSVAASSSVYDYVIYRSGANTIALKISDGTTLSTNTDAAVVLQATVDTLDATSGTGGRIYVKPGTYAMASTVTIQGDNTSNSPQVSIHAAGIQATIFNPASGVNGFTISNRAKVSLKDFAIYVRGTTDGIKVTNSSVGQRGCWQSEFKNIYINGDDATHTGWGINAENFFRSTMENIEMNQVGNGMLLKAIDTSTGYNPGDSTFTRMFIELRNRAGGTAYQLDSPSTGDMNQMVFSMCEGYGGGTAQTGVLLSGASGSNNHTHWIGINLENFDTIIDIQSGRNNVFDLNYVVTRDAVGTTYFKTGSTAYGNKISCKYMDTYTRSVVVINDANTLATQRNRFENIVIQGTATTLTFTRVDATYLHNIFDNAIGGGGVLEVASSSVTTNAVTVNATSGFFTDTTDINTDTTRTVVTLTNQAIRSSSVVSCFMMSTPDANAMLIASCVPADGSCTISIRNVGTGNQTSTFTMGFIVKQ